jgi:hypothetical protein
MSQITFSIQTGYHPERMPGVLQNIVDTASNPEDLEVVLVTHEDDPDSHHFTHPRLNIKTFVFDENYSSAMKTEFYLKETEGNILSGMSDDYIIHTKGWDEEFKRMFAEYPDQILLVGINDLMQMGALFTIPIISRRSVEIVGYLVHPAYQYYRVDDHIHHTYDILRRLGHDRIIYREDIIFEHNHYVMVNGKRAYAKAFTDNANHDGFCYWMLEGQRKIDALKLAMEIDSYDNGHTPLRHHEQVYCEKLTEINDGLTNFRRVD